MKILLISTRIEGFIVSFLFLFMAVARLVASILHPNPSIEIDFDVYVFFSLSFVATIAYVMAWRHEGLGGLVLTFCGIGISYVEDWRLGLPFFIVGQLFVLYWFVMRSKSSSNTLKENKKGL